MVATMLQLGFNGIDIDYEWTGPFQPNPAGGKPALAVPVQNNANGYYQTAPFSQAEADGYAQLVYDIRQDLNQLTPPPGQPSYKLTVAMFGGVDKIDELNNFKNAKFNNESDLKIILDNVTQVDLMTYDFHGSFDASPVGQQSPNSISNFHSGFSLAPDDPTQNPALRQYNVQGAVTALLSADPNDPQFSSSKVVIGVPAYARIVRLAQQPASPTPSHAVGIFDPLASSEQQAALNTDVAGEYEGDYLYQYKSGGGAQLVDSGTIDYKCILQYPNDAESSDCNYASNVGSHAMPVDLQFYGMSALPQPGQPGYAAATPWAYGANTRTFMSFDNSLSATHKANYVINNHLGGAMIWELDGDVSPLNPNYQKQSLVNAIYQVFVHATKLAK